MSLTPEITSRPWIVWVQVLSERRTMLPLVRYMVAVNPAVLSTQTGVLSGLAFTAARVKVPPGRLGGAARRGRRVIGC